jgi:hypothetical protein
VARVSLALVNAQVELIRLALNNGYIRLYSGLRPSEPENAITTAVLVAECRIQNPSAPIATNGELIVTVLDEDATLSGGVVIWARVLQSDGATVIEDCSVGVAGSGADIIISPTNSVAINKRLSITYTHKINRGL